MSMPARDLPGPRPENQRKRRELRGPRRSLIGVLVVVAALALPGGLALLASSDGLILRRSVDALAGSPFTSFRSTGALLVVIGATQALAAVLLVGHYVRARMVALVAALIAVAWALLQMMLLDGATWLQLSMFGAGALEILLVAGCTPRKAGTHKQRMGRR